MHAKHHSPSSRRPLSPGADDAAGTDGAARLVMKTVRQVDGAGIADAGLCCSRLLEQSSSVRNAYLCSPASRFKRGLAAQPGEAATGRG